MRALRLAIVDDSAFVRKALCRIFEREPTIRVVGAAASGEELLANLGKWRPEVITLDLNMPGMGGLATLDRIRTWRDLPVIILSTHSSEDAPLTIEALHRGAVDFIDKQKYSLVDFEGLRKVLLAKIHSVTGLAPGNAEASQETAAPAAPRPPAAPVAVPPHPATPSGRYQLLVIGASTGGPPAIQRILEHLTQPIPVPVVMVQHMPEGFTEAFTRRLDAHLPFPVLEPTHGRLLEPGSAYLAPAGSHLQVSFTDNRLQAVRTRFPEKVPHRPAIDILFRSAARVAASGHRVLAVLLTGMGNDGAAGLLELARSGAFTIGQSESSCVVYGMPKVAKELGAVREELPLDAIAPRLNHILCDQLST